MTGFRGTLTRFSLQLASSTRRIKFPRRDSCQFLQVVLISNSLSLNRNSCHLRGTRVTSNEPLYRGDRRKKKGATKVADQRRRDREGGYVRKGAFSLINALFRDVFFSTFPRGGKRRREAKKDSTMLFLRFRVGAEDGNQSDFADFARVLAPSYTASRLLSKSVRLKEVARGERSARKRVPWCCLER